MLRLAITKLGFISVALTAIMLHLPTPAIAEVVYVHRSELFGYMMGEQAGKAIQGIMDMQAFNAGYQAGYAELERMREELVACGDCAKRAQLIRSIGDLQAYLIKENELFCTGVDAVRGLTADNPAALDTVNRLTGTTDVCESYKREVEINQLKISIKNAREQLDRRVKAGDMRAYSEMGEWIRTEFEKSRAMSGEDRRYFSCFYFMTGARKGDVSSLVSLPGKCWLDEDEYREVSKMLVQCVQTQEREHRCAHELENVANAYSSARRDHMPYPMAADDRESLRLRQAALAYWERQQAGNRQDESVRERVAGVRQQLALQQQELAPAPQADSAERAEMHAHMRQWCEGMRERSGRAEILSYDCACFVRETDKHVSEGRLVWARVKREGIFDFDLVEVCADRAATADAWVAHQRTQLPATGRIDAYLACARTAIGQDLPIAHFKQRYAAGWKGVIHPKCGSA